MFKIGADVYTTDGQAGKLMKVVIDPEAKTVTHLIVEKGFLQKIDRVVPLEAMAQTGDDGIRLSVSTAELERFPQFTETHFRPPDPGWEHAAYQVDDPSHVLRWGIHYAPPLDEEYVVTRDEEIKRGVDADQIVISKGSPVYDRDGHLGEVVELQADESSGQIAYLVVKPGLLSQNLTIPMSAVTSVSDTAVNVNMTREEIVGQSGTGDQSSDDGRRMTNDE